MEILQKAIQPFEDIEKIAATLGIPYSDNVTGSADRNNNASVPTSEIGIFNVDPRSPEFQDILQRLSSAVSFLKEHPEIMEAERYRVWLEKLQTRAVSLVGRAMRDLVDKAAKQCREAIQHKLFTNKPGQDKTFMEDIPLESTAIYQKFRGLSYRMRELASVLIAGGLATVTVATEAKATADMLLFGSLSRNSDRLMDIKTIDQPVLTEVKKVYALARVELLLPFIKESWISSLAHARAQHTKPVGSGVNLASIVEEAKGIKSADTSGKNNGDHKNNKGFLSLSGALRQVFSTLLRVTQLEHQLFESLFVSVDAQDNKVAKAAAGSASTATPASSGSNTLHKSFSFRTATAGISSSVAAEEQSGIYTEILQIVESVCNATRDFLRPLIIRESSVDELCRLITVLREDIYSQITILPVPAILSKQLLVSLDSTINDAKERVAYCAETRLRQDVQLFEPLPSQLSYPDILETYEESKKAKASSHSDVTATEDSSAIENLYQTWYPPMRHTLSLLSKLYGVVASPVFEDFARRSIELCVNALRVGSDGVKRTHPAIHGDLFLVRHLLILREQLVPFEIRLQSIEKQLDFTTTGHAFSTFFRSGRNMLRFDVNNGILLFAREGIPNLQELHTDAKKELDGSLKKACIAFKLSAIKMLLGPLDTFMAKVAAFLGDAPFQALGSLDDSDIVTPTFDSDGGNESIASSSKSAPASLTGNRRTPLLSTEAKNMLKGQAFIRPERIKEMLEQVQSILLQKMPEMKEMMKVCECCNHSLSFAFSNKLLRFVVCNKIALHRKHSSAKCVAKVYSSRI